MPYERDILIVLDTDEGVVHYLRVQFRQDRGQIYEFVVQYEVDIGDIRHQIVRFDNAHGFPHRDLLSPKGLQSKTTMPNLTNAEALSFAVRDIRERYREYLKWFQRELQRTQT